MESNEHGFNSFKAVYVNSSQQYRQSDYGKVLENHTEKRTKLWAWKNDKAVAEIAILCAEEDLKNVKAVSSALSGESGNIPPSNIKLSFIKDVKAYGGHAGWYANNPLNLMPKGEREYYPEVIYSSESVDIKNWNLQLLWLEVSTEEVTAAGVYSGKITISADNAEKTEELELTLEVLDIVMPKPGRYLFDTEYWSYPYNVAYYYNVEPFSNEHIEILKQHMTLYKNLGGHAVTASIVEEAWGGQTYGGGNEIHYPSMIKWIKKSDGSWVFDYTHFDKWVELNKSIGIADKIICYSLMPWNGVIKYYDEAKKKMKKAKAKPMNKKDYAEIWRPFLQSFVKHLDDKGWFESAYIGFDERRGMDTAFDLIDSIKNKDGLALKKSAAFNDFKHNAAIFERLDCASVGLDEVRANLKDFKEVVKQRRKKGQETTIYTATEHVPNSFTKSIPAESYWTIMFAASLNTTGFLRWAYDAWVENPLEDSTHWSFPAGDCFLVYPSPKDGTERESKYSLRLAKLDEGVRDVNKLYFMRENSSEAAKEVEKLFSQIKSDYEFYTVSKTNIWGRTAKWLTESGKEEMLSDMEEVKRRIYEISKMYCEKNK